jgi:hypothetical protein
MANDKDNHHRGTKKFTTKKFYDEEIKPLGSARALQGDAGHSYSHKGRHEHKPDQGHDRRLDNPTGSGT